MESPTDVLMSAIITNLKKERDQAQRRVVNLLQRYIPLRFERERLVRELESVRATLRAMQRTPDWMNDLPDVAARLADSLEYLAAVERDYWEKAGDDLRREVEAAEKYLARYHAMVPVRVPNPEEKE